MDDSVTDSLKWDHVAPDLSLELKDYLASVIMPAVSQLPQTTAEIVQYLQLLRAFTSSISQPTLT